MAYQIATTHDESTTEFIYVYVVYIWTQMNLPYSGFYSETFILEMACFAKITFAIK